jgi:hypothetical protein
LPQDLLADADPGAASPISRRFRDKVAAPESGAAGYQARNDQGALGRYQLTPRALRGIGWKRDDGSWTGRFGITSDEEFLANPEAQEHALAEFLERTRKEAVAEGLFARLGKTIDGIVAPSEITEAGIMAAAHRMGARNLREYLEHIESTGWRSDPTIFPEGEEGKKYRAIETRLREFSQERYLRSFPQKRAFND